MKVKVYPGGYMPMKAHFDDAGYDFRSPETFELRSGESHTVDLRVAVQIPIGWAGIMCNKSGLSVKFNVLTNLGIVDSGYRGTIVVRVTNYGDGMTYRFERGDKLTQMILVPVGLFDLEEVDELDPAESGRNNSGFGSTGK